MLCGHCGKGDLCPCKWLLSPRSREVFPALDDNSDQADRLVVKGILHHIFEMQAWACRLYHSSSRFWRSQSPRPGLFSNWMCISSWVMAKTMGQTPPWSYCKPCPHSIPIWSNTLLFASQQEVGLCHCCTCRWLGCCRRGINLSTTHSQMGIQIHGGCTQWKQSFFVSHNFYGFQPWPCFTLSRTLHL